MIWAINNNQRVMAKPNTKAICQICQGEVIPKCGVVKTWHWAHKSLSDCDTWAEPESEWHLNWKNEFPEEEQEVTIEKDGVKHRADIYEPHKMKVIELQSSPISADDICDREIFYKNMMWILNGETFGKNFEIRNKLSYLTFNWKNPPTNFFYSDKPIFIDFSHKYNLIEEENEDVGNRLTMVHSALKLLVGKEPKEYDFSKYKYSYVQDLTKEEMDIKKAYELWSEVSKEYNESNNLFELFGAYNEKVIFIIKKLYKDIPCRGWGYLISKEEFLDGEKKG